MRAESLMTKEPVCATAEDSARRVAELMAENDCGCMPVVEGRSDTHVIGIVTDRDLAVRGIARGKGPETPVSELMTSEVCTCSSDDDVRDVERLMTDRQIRRVVVADADGCCVGIISQADLALAAEEGLGVDDREVARVVERISIPRSEASWRAHA
jgi:CBS domain-containing protein